MGWSTGSSLMSDIISGIEETDLKHDVKVELYKILIEKFEDYDCDTLDECYDESEAFQEALFELHPDYAEELLGDDDYLDE